jgi:general secretion pathway protein F
LQKNINDAYLVARQSGIKLISVSNLSGSSFKFRPATHFNLALFTEELIAILSAGISLIETLETLSERQQTTPQTQAVLLEIARHMRQGKSFSVALKSFT